MAVLISVRFAACMVKTDMKEGSLKLPAQCIGHLIGCFNRPDNDLVVTRPKSTSGHSTIYIFSMYVYLYFIDGEPSRVENLDCDSDE